MLRIYLTNMCKYNEGYLIGEWVTLPVDDEELEEVKKRIGINKNYEEWFITDYESDIDGVEISEYTSVEKLNAIAAMLEDLDECEQEIVSALLTDGYTMEEALDKKDDCCVWFDCDDMTDLAERVCEDLNLLDGIPENLRYYFDYAAYGRDLMCEGQYIFTNSGNCVEIMY